MASDTNQKVDPIRARYFDPLERAEILSNIAFYAAAVLSVLVLLVNREHAKDLYAHIQVAFLVTAIAGFVLAIAVRVYFSPRAQDMRLGDFLSKAFGVRLIPERTEGYYNTASQDDPMRNVGAQALENSFFAKEVCLGMCRNERVVIGVYIVVWMLALFNRNTDFDVMIVASQILFSEQLISRFVRLEWLRSRSESVFDNLYLLLQTDLDAATFQARIVQELVKYENTKSNAAVTLSSRIFNKLNPTLSAQWEKIRRDLHL
jgi:hypothetical protein